MLIKTTKAPPRARDRQQPRPRPNSRWLVAIGIATLSVAIWLVIAGMTNDHETASGQAEQAYRTRPQGLAERYETERRARADQVYTARLQGLADGRPRQRTTVDVGLA